MGGHNHKTLEVGQKLVSAKVDLERLFSDARLRHSFVSTLVGPLVDHGTLSPVTGIKCREAVSSRGLTPLLAFVCAKAACKDRGIEIVTDAVLAETAKIVAASRTATRGCIDTPIGSMPDLSPAEQIDRAALISVLSMLAEIYSEAGHRRLGVVTREEVDFRLGTKFSHLTAVPLYLLPRNGSIEFRYAKRRSDTIYVRLSKSTTSSGFDITFETSGFKSADHMTVGDQVFYFGSSSRTKDIETGARTGLLESMPRELRDLLGNPHLAAFFMKGDSRGEQSKLVLADVSGGGSSILKFRITCRPDNMFTPLFHPIGAAIQF